MTSTVGISFVHVQPHCTIFVDVQYDDWLVKKITLKRNQQKMPHSSNVAGSPSGHTYANQSAAYLVVKR